MAARNAGCKAGELLGAEDDVEALDFHLTATVALRAEEAIEFRRRTLFTARMIAFAVADVLAGHPPLEDIDDDENFFSSSNSTQPQFAESQMPQASPFHTTSQDATGSNSKIRVGAPSNRPTVLPMQSVPVVQ